MKQEKAKKWRATKVQFLLENTESGVYYARLYRDGKQVWKSLKTQVFSVAQARLGVEMKDLKQAAKTQATVESAKLTARIFGVAYFLSPHCFLKKDKASEMEI